MEHQDLSPSLNNYRLSDFNNEAVQESYGQIESGANVSESIDLGEDLTAIKSKYKQVRREN